MIEGHSRGYKYKIYDNLMVEVWHDDVSYDQDPFFRQEAYPSGRPFENLKTTQDWLSKFIDYLNSTEENPVEFPSN